MPFFLILSPLTPPIFVSSLSPSIHWGNKAMRLGTYFPTALKNASNFFGSRWPSVRTPLHRSTPKGWTWSIASRTLPAFKPPARKTGTGDCSTMRRLRHQSWTRPVPPSCLIVKEGLPLSNNKASTCAAACSASSSELSSRTWMTWTILTEGNAARMTA